MFRFSILAVSLLFSLPAFSGTVSLYPTTVQAVPTEKSAALTLENKGDKPERYQVQTYAWSQSQDGRDQMQPTRDVLAAPSIVEVPAKSKRVIRVVRVAGQGTAGYYRLMLRQLPDPTDAKTSGLKVLVNQNLPVAFEDPKSGQPVLTARITADGVGVLLSNTGATAAKLSAIGPAGQPAWREGALGWVLPGQNKLVELNPGLKAASLSITVNGSPITVAAN